MEVNDVLIIGAGPAGLTAAVYAQRYGLKSVVLEKFYPGGLAATADRIENIPGIPEAVRGMEWMQKLQKQAENFGTSLETGQVVQSVEKVSNIIHVKTDEKTFACRALIIATGSEHKHLGIPGENKLRGRGVSTCATCDAMFFRGKDVAVIGGGNTALQEALVLANVVQKVYIVHRRTEFRGEHALVKSLEALSNVEFILPYIPKSIEGTDAVEKLILENVQDARQRTLDVAAVFICVGFIPHSKPFQEVISCTKEGYILVNTCQETSVPGVYAAGDVTDSPLKQIVTAAADGAKAAFQGYQYIQKQKTSN